MTDILTLADTELEEQLRCEDAKIERAAVALCWIARPALATGQATPLEWWELQSETTRRMRLYRARTAIQVWESEDGL